MVPNKSPLRIVMVDDDRDDVFLTKMAFKRADFATDFAGLNSGKSLFEYIKNNGIGSVDLLLLDLNMPIQNGHDILKELSTYPHIEDLCVVMFSTSRRAIDKEIAERLGASAFIVKPGTVSETNEFVKNVGEIFKTSAYEMAC